MNIIVLGYYSHGNYGDDLFEVIFKKLYVNYNLIFYDPNKITIIPDNVDIIVCGGGDIINDFFMKQIVKLKLSAEAKYKKKIPTYAISVGITYKKSVILGKSHYLDIFDYFIVRNKIDVDLLKERYSEDHIIYMPDVVHLLQQSKPKKMLSYLTNLISKARPVLGIFLTNTIANEGKNTKYEEEVANLVKLIEALPDKFDIHLVPFNTGANKHENDDLLNKKIFRSLNSLVNKRVFVKLYTLKQLVDTFRNSMYAYGICMRYHAHILCLTYKVPFMSISMTNKTFEYMKDFGNSEYLIDYNNRILDINNCVEVFNKLINDKNWSKKHKELINIAADKFIYPIKNKIVRNTGPEYFDNEIFVKFFNNFISGLIQFLFKDQVSDHSHRYAEITKIFIKNYCLKDVYNLLRLNLPNDNIRSSITNYIIYQLFNTFDTTYNYGLNEKVIECNLYENILWIYEDKSYKGLHRKDQLYNKIEIVDKDTKNILLNFSYIDNNFSKEIHRSGWSYVSSNLISRFHNVDATLIVDLYMDKTFLWNSAVYEKLKKIPYTKPWIGFIHHTPNPEYTENSLDNIINSNNFKLSLKKCKGIIVLSNYLRQYLEKNLKGKIPIYNLTHPTETPEIRFTWDKFIQNSHKKVIQIGGWLRNSYAIYELAVNSKKLNISKYLLQGNKMENYIKPDNLNHNDIFQQKNNKSNKLDLQERMCNVTSNKYLQGLVSHINKQYDSVTLISHLNNEEYDNLLAENIVFINLINASACNTLIECVVRNTPILINRIEAVEEVLGKNYPLFYDSIAEANELVVNIDKIKEGYEYLNKLDKKSLHIDTFIQEFTDIIKKII